jgi:hypothetical protein
MPRCPPRQVRPPRWTGGWHGRCRWSGYGQVIAGRWVAGGAEPAAGCFGKLILLGGSAYRTEIGPGETGAGHGLLLRDRLGGIWEAASGANRPEPVPTELKAEPLIWPFTEIPGRDADRNPMVRRISTIRFRNGAQVDDLIRKD